jgi:hypothetical protein
LYTAFSIYKIPSSPLGCGYPVTKLWTNWTGSPNRPHAFFQLSTLEEPGTEVGVQSLTINVYMQGHVTIGDFNPAPPADKHHKDMMAYLLSWYVPRLDVHLKPAKSCIAPGSIALYWLRTI